MLAEVRKFFPKVIMGNEDRSCKKINKKRNLIDTNGNLLSQQWFDNIFSFNKNGIAQVELNRKWNLIDKNGKLLSKQWFDSYDDAYYFMRELLK